MLRTMFFIVALTVLCTFSARAQTSQVALSNMTVFITDPGDHQRQINAVVYQADTSAVPEWVQLNVKVDIGSLAQLDKLSLTYGTSQGASDLLDMELEAVTVKGQTCLHHQGVLYPIRNGRADIRRLIPASTLLAAAHLELQATDQSNNNSNTLSRGNIR